LKDSTKFCARFSFALSFLLVMAMSDFSSPGYPVQEKSSGIKRLDEERLEDKRGVKGEGDSLFVCGFTIARSENHTTASRPRTPPGPERQKGRVIASFFLLLHGGALSFDNDAATKAIASDSRLHSP
jgi:hypothetical protein